MRRGGLLTWAVGAAGGVLAAFAVLAGFHAAAVVQAGAPWERAWLLAIHASWGPAATGAAAAVSLLGYASAILPVLVATGLLWRLDRPPRLRLQWLVAQTAALTLADFAAKALFNRPRPALFPHAFVSGASYPSGHALFAVGFYGLIAALLLARAGAAARFAGLALWALLALTIGLSRLVLGVHWPTDVLAGYAAGAALWAALAATARRLAAAPPGAPPAGG
ncbi:MAG TPA: phosphatase PAP2 family protein [Bacillota bacterium]|nr:phosphatase PAP2 family protein [Bacillota bacterium]